MPALDWLDRAEALTAADRVPCRLLALVCEHGAPGGENLPIQIDRRLGQAADAGAPR